MQNQPKSRPSIIAATAMVIAVLVMSPILYFIGKISIYLADTNNILPSLAFFATLLMFWLYYTLRLWAIITAVSLPNPIDNPPS